MGKAKNFGSSDGTDDDEVIELAVTGDQAKGQGMFSRREVQVAMRRSHELTWGPPQVQATVVASDIVPPGTSVEPDPDTPGTSRSFPVRRVQGTNATTTRLHSVHHLSAPKANLSPLYKTRKQKKIYRKPYGFCQYRKCIIPTGTSKLN